MANKNDKLIMKMEEKIEALKIDIKPVNHQFATDASLVWDGQRINIRTANKAQLEQIFVEMGAYETQAEKDGVELTYNGYAVSEWRCDIASQLAKLENRSKSRKLEAARIRLNQLLSQDTATERMIKSIAEDLDI